MNRDERHEREQEKLPAHHWGDDILAPLDPQSNGTWVAVNTKTKNWGALLNGYTETKPQEPVKSRGQILPDLLRKSDPLNALKKMDYTHFMSFKLILNAQLFHWDGKKIKEENFHSVKENVSFQTSSSYNQDEVIEIRKKQFECWVDEGNPFNEEGVPTLHLSRDPDPLRSIMMYRDYSRTKSITHLHVGEEVTMHHWLQTANKH